MSSMRISAIFFLALLLATNSPVAAQSADPLSGLRRAMQQVHCWGYSYSFDEQSNEHRYDSLNAANDFIIGTVEAIGSQSSLMKADLSRLDTTGLSVLTSADGRLRIFSWDAEEGGTMHYYNNIAAYQAGSGIRTERWNNDTTQDGGDPGGSYYKLETLPLKDGTAVYLAFYQSQFSTKDRASGVKALTIRGGRLVPYLLFRTATKQLSEIAYSYDFFTVEDTPGQEPHDLHLSKDKAKLYVPVVNEAAQVTGRFLIYRFDGRQFVFDKSMRH